MHPALAADLFQPLQFGEWIGVVVDAQVEVRPFLLALDDERGRLLATLVAADGFAREDRLNIPVTAPTRNYRDRSHKPELLVALGPFEALAGDVDPTDVQRQLSRWPCVSSVWLIVSFTAAAVPMSGPTTCGLSSPKASAARMMNPPIARGDSSASRPGALRVSVAYTLN